MHDGAHLPMSHCVFSYHFHVKQFGALLVTFFQLHFLEKKSKWEAKFEAEEAHLYRYDKKV